jgi:hypothetical protein
MTSRRQLEKDIEKRCVEYAESLGWLHIKLDKAKRDWPDQQFFGPQGRCFLVEFKRPGEKARPAQKRNHEKLENLGHQVTLIDSFETFIETFNTVLTDKKKLKLLK